MLSLNLIFTFLTNFFLTIKSLINFNIMSFQAKNNRNAAKRIYNLNSLNNPLILDILKTQDPKHNINPNSLYHSIQRNDPP